MEWLKEIRISIGITQGEVASICGISRQYYSLIEKGKRTVPVKTAKKIANALNFDWEKFYL